MSKISKSPKRNTFQQSKYLERKAAEGRTPDNDSDVQAMMDLYKNWAVQKQQDEENPSWAKDNMEYDLRTTDWILEKVRASESYAQNLYAAMCNNEFQHKEVWPILTDKRWSCSWRYAGGIIADMREHGDYIDWYCSGIRGGMNLNEEDYTDEEKQRLKEMDNFVGEGQITDEIRQDLLKLGWIVINEDD
jgi:hypothetical protein